MTEFDMSYVAANLAVVVTLAIFCVGIVFQVGRLSQKVDNLEQWRREVLTDLRAIRSVTDYLAQSLHVSGMARSPEVDT